MLVQHLFKEGRRKGEGREEEAKGGPTWVRSKTGHTAGSTRLTLPTV